MIDYKNKLDKYQYEAVVSSLKGNKLCVASAGTGKTHTLTHRIAYLVDNGVNPNSIMLLTFTNKVANEMIERTQNLIGNKDVKIFGGTFHHIAICLYYKYISLLKENNTERCSVISPDDSIDIVDFLKKQYIEDNYDENIHGSLSEYKKDLPSSKLIASTISKYFNHNIEMTQKNLYKEFDYEKADIIFILSEKYKKYKIENLYYDFDDLLKLFLKLLKHKTIGQMIKQQYAYLFVDEVQDINYIQYCIIKEFYDFSKNVFMVGDAKQSIYEFRGSKSEYITNNKKYFENCEIFYLKYNYRSSHAVIDNTNMYIGDIKPDLPKDENLICTKNEEGFVSIVPTLNEFSQGQEVVDIVRKIKTTEPDVSVGILLRINSHSRTIEQSLIYNKIPYHILCALPFFSRKHIRDMISLIKFIQSPIDKINYNRFSLMFTGIGPKASEKIYNIFKDAGFDKNILIDVVDKSIKKAKYKDSAILLTSIFCYCLENKKSPVKIIEKFYNDFYKKYIEDYFDEDSWEYRKEDIKGLMDLASEYKSIPEFLTFLNLMEQNKDKDVNSNIVITTVHKAKGLEYDYVIIPYSNDNVFPFKSNNREVNEQEEENIYYVAMTRAKIGLYILYVSVMQTYSGFESLEPSPYIVPLINNSNS